MEGKVMLPKKPKCLFKIKLPAIIWRESKETRDPSVYRDKIKD